MAAGTVVVGRMVDAGVVAAGVAFFDDPPILQFASIAHEAGFASIAHEAGSA